MDKPVTTDVNDTQRNKLLNRRLDIRVLPLLCWIYLLNFLDRGNIGQNGSRHTDDLLILETGNAKVLNKETGDDLLTQAKMNASQYAIVLTIFSLCYAIFEVPSNWFVVSYRSLTSLS